jgi:hypothetical protein
MTAVVVSDEIHKISDILTGNPYNNSLYLNHRPRFQTAITVSAGTITAGTDYEHGVVYFSTLPTGDFTVQYMSEPDKYYGEYINTVQAAIHNLERVVGASSGGDEGFRQAEFMLNSKSAAMGSKLPNAINVRAISQDFEIRSTTDPVSPNGMEHTITLGNGIDTVRFDADTILALSSTGLTNIRLGDETGDRVYISDRLDVTGITTIGPSGSSKNTSISASLVTGYQATGAPYTANSLALAVHGDEVIYGDLYVHGETITVGGTRNIAVNVYETDLEVANRLIVGGDVRLGTTSSRNVLIGGNLDVTGMFTIRGAGGAPVIIDSSVIFSDGALKGPYSQCKIDTLDPSLVEKVRTSWRSDFRQGYINRGGVTALYSGTTTATGAANELVDSAASGPATALPTGTYFTGKFNEGDYIAVVNAPVVGIQEIPVKSFNATPTYKWTLARNLNYVSYSPTGLTYSIRHKDAHSNYFIMQPGLSIVIAGTAAQPMVGSKNGKVKILTSWHTLALSANQTSYVFMSLLEAVNGIEQDQPTFYTSTSNIEDDWSILVGKVVTNGTGVTSVVSYQANGKLDTTWTKFDTVASGNVKQAGTDWSIDMRVGNTKRRYEMDVEGWIAADSAGVPDVATMVKLPMDSTIYTKAVADESVTIKTTGSSYLGISVPYWLRIIVK